MDPALGGQGVERRQCSWEQQQNKQTNKSHESRSSKAAVTRSSKKKKRLFLKDEVNHEVSYEKQRSPRAVLVVFHSYLKMVLIRMQNSHCTTAFTGTSPVK